MEQGLKRRSFVTGIGLTAIVLSGCASTVTTPKQAAPLDLPDGFVEVTVDIVWTNRGGAPVEGAKVFEHATNKLLGETGKDGKLKLLVQNGTVLRLTEPNYGQQQALRLVQGELVPNAKIRVARAGEGWTWT